VLLENAAGIEHRFFALDMKQFFALKLSPIVAQKIFSCGKLLASFF